MINQQLLDYINQQIKEGAGKEQIKNALVERGWQVQQVDEAFSFLSNPTDRLGHVPPTPPQAVASLPGALTLFSRAWALYKRQFSVLLGITAILTLLMMPLAIIIRFHSGVYFSAIQSAGGIGTVVLIMILFFEMISRIWGRAALIYAIKDSHEEIGVVKAYRRGWRVILSYLWVSFLVGFITLGGLFLFIVPGIIFGVWFSFAAFIVIAENAKGMDALLKSREYVRGRWGGVLWRLFFINTLYFIAYLVPLGIFRFLKIPFGAEIIQSAAMLFITPLVVAYLFLLYGDLKVTKAEGSSMHTGSKKTILIISGLLGLAIPVLLFLLTFLEAGSAREAARDARRQVDMMQIFNSMELCYVSPSCGNYVYPTSVSMPTAIGTFLPAVPADPLKTASYGWISNIGSAHTYCAYAKLEKKSSVRGQSLYMTASPNGTRQKSMAAAPATLADCD